MLVGVNSIVECLTGVQKEAIQQVSVDLHVKSIVKVSGGVIRKNERSINPTTPVKSTYHKDSLVWELKEGVYDVCFEENCNIPENKTGFITHRSSLVRIGGSLNSGIYDPGYHSKTGMGAFLTVGKDCTLLIEKGARIATFFMLENQAIDKDKLYQGKYQGQ